MAQSNQRLVLDLDDIERQLKEAQLPPPPPKNDPLAELARIVGQDDPFRTLIAGEKQARRPAPTDRDALFVDPEPYGGRGGHDLHASRGDRAAYAGAADEGAAYAGPDQDFQPLERRRSRKGLIAVGLVLGTAIAAVAGALALRTPAQVTATGEPPTITADKEPLKVQPENPGGVEIPNQNAQVHDRAGADKQTRIVNREEQPIDVQQAARTAQGAASGQAAGVVPPSTATPGNAPSIAPNTAVASLGEPKRVRTVSVRPDGTIVGPDQPPASTALSAAPAAAGGPALTGATTPAPVPPPAAAPQRPRPETRPAPAAETATPAQPVAPAQPTAPARPAPPAAAPNGPLQIAPSPAQPPSAAQRTASVPRPAPVAAEATNAVGGFSVQLSVMNSEDEARKQYQAFQRKYAGPLAGRSPLIRAAEVNGKTIYRVRVGPMSRDDATELCTKLKAAGGPCFVAKN
jgi:SPOR domain